MPSSGKTLEKMQDVLDLIGSKPVGPLYDALLELEEAAWSAGYEAAKAGYERLVPS
jgi:hypothetical protein